MSPGGPPVTGQRVVSASLRPAPARSLVHDGVHAAGALARDPGRWRRYSLRQCHPRTTRGLGQPMRRFVVATTATRLPFATTDQAPALRLRYERARRRSRRRPVTRRRPGMLPDPEAGNPASHSPSLRASSLLPMFLRGGEEEETSVHSPKLEAHAPRYPGEFPSARSSQATSSNSPPSASTSPT